MADRPSNKRDLHTSGVLLLDSVAFLHSTQDRSPSRARAAITQMPYLLDFCNELLALVIKDDSLTDEDLANLRLTCKHINHYATDALRKRRFVDLTIWYSDHGFNWLADLLASDLGSDARSVALEMTWSLDPAPKMCQPPVKYSRKSKFEPDYSRLEEITTSWDNGSVRSLKKVLDVANHLKIFRLEAPQRSLWVATERFAVYHHTFDKNDAVFGNIKSDKLSELSIINICFSAEILKRLLERHRSTIRILRIQSCILIQGSWLQILGWIRTELHSLQTFHLDVRHEALKKKIPCYQTRVQTASYSERSPYKINVLAESLRLDIDGKEAVSAGLSKLLEERNGI